MFCPHCGSNLNDAAKFCGSCGKQIQANAHTPMQEKQEKSIDLSSPEYVDLSQVKASDPTKTYKGTVKSAFLMLGIWIASFFLLAWIIYSFSTSDFDDSILYYASIAFIGLPVGIVGLIMTLRKKKVEKALPSVAKNVSLLFHIMTILETSVVFSLAYYMGGGGEFGAIILLPATLIFSIMFIISIFVFSKGVEKEGMYKLWIAFFVSFLVGIPGAWLLIKLIELLFTFLVILFAAAILFFVLGGRVVYFREV